MLKDKKEQLKKMSIFELEVELNNINELIFFKRMNKYTNIEKNYKLIRVLRKNLACVNTFLSQKHKEYLNAK